MCGEGEPDNRDGPHCERQGGAAGGNRHLDATFRARKELPGIRGTGLEFRGELSLSGGDPGSTPGEI